MKKYLDLNDKERRKFNSEVDGRASIVTGDSYEPPKNRLEWDMLGLCKDCKHLEAARTEFGSIFARCNEFECTLRAGDPVVECTDYQKISFLSLEDMKEICIILDPNRKKAGFIT